MHRYLSTALDKAKESLIVRVVVGVGDKVNVTELVQIASSPDLVFLVDSFDGLRSINRDLICTKLKPQAAIEGSFFS